jgi:hypothetical protein
MHQAPPTRYLYIVGRGHSGSTVFSILAGQSSAVASEGEIIAGFRDGYEAKRCANRELFSESKFWTQVRSVFERRAGTDFTHAVAALNHQAHYAHVLPNLLAASGSTKVQETRRLVEALYDSISEASQRPVVLDSSKELATAVFLLRHVGQIKLIHFVRSAFGIADSHVKRIKHAKQFDMFGMRFRVERHYLVPLVLSAIVWSLENLFCELLHLIYPTRVIRFHYEDLCSQPVASLERLERFTGVSLAVSKIVAAEKQVMQPNHALSGNHMMRNKSIVFAPEIGLTRYLTSLDKAMVALFTFPLMIAYGYFGSRARKLPITAPLTSRSI